MGKLSLVLIAALWSVTALAGNAARVGPSAFSTLIGHWKVQVEGEARLGEFAVYRLRAPATDTVALEAGYGWADSYLTFVDATCSLKNGRLQITITTPASSVIRAEAEQMDSNTFQGTFTDKFGNSKTIHISRSVLDLSNIDRSFADEDKDYGVAPTRTLATTYHQETPLSVPGASTIKTLALKRLIDSASPPIVIDVLGGTPGKRVVIPSAIWLGFDAGDGNVFAAEKAKFATVLSTLTNADKSRAIAFYCLGVKCWLSYNASLRAVEEGYKNVYWYRGGWESWNAARLPFVKAEQFAW
ncbi:MAG: rhodanese-like domain-containing protein [Sterolibacterium sp.]